MNKKILIIIVAVILQCIALFYMCFQREYIVKTGDKIFIRTVPIDPRDLFRGYYVRLNYEISTLPENYAQINEAEEMRKSERKVYLTYETDSQNILSPLKLTLSKPKNERFIKGFTTYSWNEKNINLRYGIEKFFMQQGKSKILERGQQFEGIRIPLEMEARVGKENGILVLTGYRYAGVGIGLKNLKKEFPDSFVVNIKIANTYKEKISICDPNDHSTFLIQLDENNYYDKNKELKLVYTNTNAVEYKNEDLKVLEPESVYEFNFNLSLANYKFYRGKEEIKISDLKEWSERIKISYISPSLDKVSLLEHSDKLWQGTLTTESFSRE